MTRERPPAGGRADAVGALCAELFRLLLGAHSALDIPELTDAAAAAVARAGQLDAVLVVILEGTRRTLLGGSGIPILLPDGFYDTHVSLPNCLPAPKGDCPKGDTMVWLASCAEAMDDGSDLLLIAYGQDAVANQQAHASAQGWLEVAMPAFSLALRHAQLALKLTQSSIELEAEVARRTQEVVRLSAKERYLLAQLQDQTLQLQVANDELRQLDEVKTAIISSVSHELRTPISTIKTLAHLLRRASVTPEKQRQYMTLIDTECDRQISLIDDLLALARLEAGGVTLERTPQDLAVVVARVASRLLDPIEAAGQTLRVSLAPGLEALIAAHPSELEQIVGNLLGNAHKFTPAGGTLAVSLDSDPAGLRLVVTDTGCGIPAGELGRIFETFYRVPQDDRQVPGTGLGLAITHRLVVSLGGTIGVDSVLGQGSRFTVVWPALAARALEGSGG